MNCLIVEDELPALELLADTIRQVPFLNLLGTARNASDAMSWLDLYNIDLMFLDVEMPGITGLEFLRSLTRPPLVILVSAYEQYALQGFELNVVDYLVKPVPFSRFLKAVRKAQSILKNLHTVGTLTPSETEYVFINANYSLVKVILSDIMYVEGLKDHVKIHLVSGKTVITRLLLKDVEEKLSSGKFMRVHRSYIIALDKLDTIQKTQVMIQGIEIPVSDGYRQQLQHYVTSRNF
ncbi:LytTR family DNA-binding domain-containing protein [Mucilaginibacter sp. OK283]|jgi:DNA-binding LytR/AlgR family response regulator|uniref:LytR/AlgR family response regulator transcription factor n=1 Tax=Mucilaginibacter sp. OK283 TaxID=1881049 RepID=UPI0008B61663|nr:LytTR family DNA-binding domain-containing protein [Mucilaginibacter sp. OK283]SEP40309.1 two component transcriptional regulator, LytTR family [Mucilaginibacter sp. OK283]